MPTTATYAPRVLLLVGLAARHGPEQAADMTGIRIVSDIAVYRELLDPAVPRCNHDDSEAWAALIETLLDNPEYASTVAIVGRQSVSHYRWEDTAKGYMHIYDDVLSGRM